MGIFIKTGQQATTFEIVNITNASDIAKVAELLVANGDCTRWNFIIDSCSGCRIINPDKIWGL